MFEHITSADLIVFNRCTQKDKDYLHSRNIRAMNPRATIFLDDVDEKSEDYRDNMEMPFDIDADEIDIGDEDFGLWYVDASSDPEKYDDKTVHFSTLRARYSAAAGRAGLFPAVMEWSAAQTISSSLALPAIRTASSREFRIRDGIPLRRIFTLKSWRSTREPVRCWICWR